MKINSMLFILTVVSITSLGHSRCMLERGDLFDRFHFRHATKYYDPETGLYYYGERYYSPELGRWINRDPIEEEGGINIFEFVNNNPINRVDRLGLFPLTYDLEIELDYKRVPIRVGKGGGITYANTWARGPDITQIKDAEIVKTGKCCAKIKYAPKYKIIIHAHWLSENEIGRSATESGYDAIIGHEQKRGGALIDGFTEYYGAIAGNGRIALKCGSVCSKNGFEDAKKKLEEYLFEISLDAWSQFYDYSLYAQSDIGRENQVDNWKYEGSLVDGFYKTYNYRKPKPFTVKTPCPNSK